MYTIYIFASRSTEFVGFSAVPAVFFALIYSLFGWKESLFVNFIDYFAFSFDKDLNKPLASQDL